MGDYILKHFDRDLLRFSARNTGDLPEVSLTCVDQEALDLMPMGMEVSDDGVARWLRRRKMPKHRAFIHSLLARYGMSLNSTMGIVDLCRCLSLNDCHWVVPAGFTKSFGQCNLYDARFDRGVASVALTGMGDVVRTRNVSSPEFTTHGMLPKCWRRISGKILLCKGGTEGASNTGWEPYSEFHAYQVARVLGVDAVAYGLARWKSTLCSTCGLFTSKEVSFVPVGRIVKSGGMQAVIDLCAGLGPAYRAMLEDMFVFDALIANTDRHFGNFGFLVDAATNKLMGPAPFFDHGNSLFNFAAPSDTESEEAFLRYADSLFPCCYLDFFAAAVPCVRERHRAGQRRLTEFRLKRHPRYNLPQRRLKLIEKAIRKRARRLLEGKENGPCELHFPF